MSSLTVRAELESLLRAEGFAHALPSRTVLENPGSERLALGIPILDVRLGGGVPVGAVTEVTGVPSSGRTGLVLALLAQVTGRQELAVYVDATDAFDPWSAARGGVGLSRVLWVRCRGQVETAFKAADAVVRGGGARVVVLDLAGASGSRLRRMPVAAYLRLQRAVERTPTALVILADQGLAGTAAAVTIRLSRARAVWVGRHPACRLLSHLGHAPAVIGGRGAVARRAG
ncbi:MAG: hypothetical protein QN178_16595 [Armatimonadota bacterium]|nr:hypothetical protein [Armatimonadota bacterium]